jgi:hypothetical protein
VVLIYPVYLPISPGPSVLAGFNNSSGDRRIFKAPSCNGLYWSVVCRPESRIEPAGNGGSPASHLVPSKRHSQNTVSTTTNPELGKLMCPSTFARACQNNLPTMQYKFHRFLLAEYPVG